MRLWPFERSRAAQDAERLLAAVTAASRNPALFGEGRAPDTLDGRFETLTLFATLALARLRSAEGAEPLAQAFTDHFFRHVDSGLREAGVGDLAVPKRMRKLAGDFLGRAHAYQAAIEARDAAGLGAAFARNIAGIGPEFAASFAQQTMKLASHQAAATPDLLFSAEGWRLGED
jgi:cytochrome b pre-mRNA-processing protein 3